MVERPYLIAAVSGAAGLAAGTLHAQTVACVFTLVCAPQIGCEPHEGIPFELQITADGASFYRGGEDLTGDILENGAEGPLGVVFNDATGRLFLTLASDGAAALTEHRHSVSNRIETSTFTGTCEAPS